MLTETYKIKSLRLVLLAAMMPILVSCTSLERTPMQTQHSFILSILDKSVLGQSPGLGNTLETSWPILQNAYPQEVVYSIKIEDIETYDWTQQVITLSATASKSLSDSFECGGARPYPLCLLQYSFVVVLNGQPLYGGRFIIPESASVVHYPIIYASADNDRATFTIRPGHPAGAITDSDPEWKDLRDERIESIFDSLGKLVK